MEFIPIVMHPGRDLTFDFECSACHSIIWLPTAQRTPDYEYCPYCGEKKVDEPNLRTVGDRARCKGAYCGSVGKMQLDEGDTPLYYAYHVAPFNEVSG